MRRRFRIAGSVVEFRLAHLARERLVCEALAHIETHLAGDPDFTFHIWDETSSGISAPSLEDFDKTLNVNVRAVFVAAKAASRHMGEGGRIINIGSTNAERMPWPGGSAYAMSKSALVGMVQGLSRDLGPRGITVNNVQPGPVNTDMNPVDGPNAASMHGLMALARHARPEEIAGMVGYLASPEAAFVTGASLNIDGGFAA